MNIEQYRKETLRTLPDLGSLINNSLHMTVGMMTEVGEIQEAFQADIELDIVNLSEEWADIKWYMANYANIHDIKTIEIDAQAYENYHVYEDGWENIIIFAGKLLDLDKKHFAYGKEPSKNVRETNLYLLNAAMERFADFWKIDKEGSLDRNIDKLKARFPDKFDTDKAINRDLETERKILEGKQ